MPDGMKVAVKKTGRIKPATLDHGPLTEIGRAMVLAQKARWARGVNANDQSAKPLSKKYLFIKQKIRGIHRPIRDMHLSGETIANFQLRKAINGVIRAENTTRKTRVRAQAAQKIAEMIGLAGSDQLVIFRNAQVQYGRALQKAFVPLSGQGR